MLRGANFSGIEYSPGEQEPLEEAHEYYLADKGMNVVRLPISWEAIQPTLGGELDATYAALIDTQIGFASARAAYVILDVHNYGRRDVDGTTYIIGETATVTSAHFNDLWTKLVRRFPHQKVIVGLMNEPHDQDADIYVAVANAAIAAIRETGDKRLILVNGNDWGVVGWRPEYTNQVKMLGIVDPKNNFAFDVHAYFDANAAGNTPILGATPLTDVLACLSWMEANERRAFWGEFAADCYNPAALTVLDDFLASIEASPSTIGWTYWGAGGWQTRHNRWMQLDPHVSRWDTSNPLYGAEPATMWADATTIDRPQMGVLLNYLPDAKAPFKPMFRLSDVGATLAAYYPPFQYTAGNWRDVSGNGLNATQATGANQPVVGSNGMVNFDGSNDRLSTSVSASDGNETIFALVTPANLTGNKTIAGPSKDGARQAVLVGNALVVNRQNTAAKCGYNSTLPTAVETSIEISLVTPATVGDQNITGVNATRTNAGYNDNVAFAAAATTVLGAKSDGGEPWSGFMTELAFLSSKPSQALRQKIEGYRKWEFGVPVPGGHPYLSAPPGL